MTMWRGRRSRHGRARLVAVTTAAVSLLAPAAVVIAGGTASYAVSGGSVTPATLALSNTNVAASSSYTLAFMPSATGSLPNNATITFVAPSGTVFPSQSCPVLGTCTYTISASSGNATISSVTLSSANQSATNNRAVLTISLGLLSPALSGTVTVTIGSNSVTNPKLASSSYSIAESTSTDPNPVASPPYSVNPGPPAQVVATGGTPQAATVGTSFQSALVATVEDSFGNPLAGQSVQFSIGHTTGGASATFARNSTPTEADVTGPSGTATSSMLQANNVTGGPYPVTASVGNLQASFFLNNGSGLVIPGPVQLSGPAAANQAKAGGVTYTIPFQSVSPVLPGDTIAIALPPGTILPGSANAYSVTANGSQVSLSNVSVNAAGTQVTIVLANADPLGAQSDFAVSVTGVTNPQTAGSYFVFEQTSRDSTPAASPAYAIAPATAAHLSLAFGDGQSANPSKPFATPLGVVVTDAFGNPVPNEPVGFSVLPAASGASASFPGPETDTSDGSGVATSHALTANATPGGPYKVTASASGLNAVMFSLTNASVLTPGPVGVSVANSAGSAGATYQVPFTTSSAGALGGCPNNCIITLVAPNGTSFSSSANKYTVAVNNTHAATVGSVFLSESAGYGSTGPGSTPNQVNIQLSSSSIASGDLVTVSVTGVTNPTGASGTYRILESTTSDGQSVPSPQYSIVAAQAASLTAALGSPQTAEAGQQLSTPLTVKLVDSFGNPISGAGVTFKAPSAGPTVTFPACPGADQCAATTDAHGEASAPAIAGQSVGAVQVVASAVAAPAVTTQFNLTNVAGPIANVTAVSGGPQSTTVQSPVAHSLVAEVTDGFGNPVSGASVVFASPPAGPGVTFAHCQSADTDLQCTVLTDSSGQATSSAMTANSDAGGPFAVMGTASGFNARFNLTNLPGPPSVVFTLGGDGQQALVFSPFSEPLQVRITDSSGNAIAGAAVTFSTPESGATATFSPCTGGNPTAYQCVVNTDALGDATSSALTAGGDPGTFGVQVGISGSGVEAFSLTDVQSGYRMVAADGGIFTFGGAPFYGSMGAQRLNAPIVGMADTLGGGYYLVASDGGIFSFGPGATFYGSMGAQRLNAPVVGMAVDPLTGGYWLVASDGGVFAFNAPFWGSMGAQRLNSPIVGMAATPEGGYYLVASDGGIFTFGPGSTFYGSAGGQQHNAPIVSMATAPGGGYWLVGSDGGIFNFGPGAVFFGSAAGEPLNRPIVAITVDPATGGYWMVASDGGVFSFDAPYYGSTGNIRLNAPIVGMAPSG